MRINLNRAHYPVTVLGPGTRIGLWVQGCTIGCAGCVSRDTWPQDGGHDIELSALIDWCQSACPLGPDGITITGGEPFEQPEALDALIEELRRWSADLRKPFDLLCYSGFPLKRLLKLHGPLVRRLDALIPEPYQQRRPMGHLWAGSDNQQLVVFTPLGIERYKSFLKREPTWKPTFQVCVGETEVWLLGIPNRNDLNTLADVCEGQGVRVRGLSWLA